MAITNQNPLLVAQNSSQKLVICSQIALPIIKDTYFKIIMNISKETRIRINIKHIFVIIIMGVVLILSQIKDNSHANGRRNGTN